MSREQEFSLTSPLAICMLLHFYAVATPYRPEPVEEWPNAQRSILRQYLHHKVVYARDGTYCTTELGDVIVRDLMAEMRVQLQARV
jgi:hypothetical protein